MAGQRRDRFRISSFVRVLLLLAVACPAASLLRAAQARRAEKNGRPATRAKNLPALDRENPKSGLYRERLRHGGIERTYLLYLPPAYDRGKKLPALVLLHGGGGRAGSVALKTSMLAEARREGFILVCPNGTGWARTWNAVHCCGRAHKAGVDDVGFVTKILDELEKTLRIDPDRVYVAGHSNGAMMAYRLAAEASERFAAVGVVAGSIGGKPSESEKPVVIGEPRQPVSVVVFHGKKDLHVPYEGGHGEKARGTRYDLSVATSAAFWVIHDECAKKPVRETLRGDAVVKETYDGGKNGTAVTVYTLLHGGHAWPGSRKARSEDPVTGDFPASDYMWKFFASHPKKKTPRSR